MGLLVRSIKLNNTTIPAFSQKEKVVFSKDDKYLKKSLIQKDNEQQYEKNAKNLILKAIGIGVSVTTIWILAKSIAYAIKNKKLKLK